MTGLGVPPAGGISSSLASFVNIASIDLMDKLIIISRWAIDSQWVTSGPVPRLGRRIVMTCRSPSSQTRDPVCRVTVLGAGYAHGLSETRPADDRSLCGEHYLADTLRGEGAVGLDTQAGQTRIQRVAFGPARHTQDKAEHT
jgi:hypothetical protein